MKQKSIRLAVFCAAFLFAAVSFCHADERILSFDSVVRVNPDATLRVTETIKVMAAEQKIKRGIYRDFPTRYRDRYGNNYVIDFNVLRVLRNGLPENYFVEQKYNGVRVYIGNKNVYLSPGEYTYTIEYVTDRQLGFFKDFDELYWNATGNGWDFIIDRASCTVVLPGGANQEVRERGAYTGPQGARGKDFIVDTDELGNTRFTTTAPLSPYEGLTIVINWPKGFVVEPTALQKFGYIIQDNGGWIAGIIGLFLILGYYLYVWHSVGRDPQKGVIIPLYEPDKNISPAAARYIMRMGYDNKVFTAAIINMAVKGYLNIKQDDDGEYSLEKTGKGDTLLSPEEQTISRKLFESDPYVGLANRNHVIISEAINKFKARMRNTLETAYFITNSKYFIKGAVISLVTLVVMGLFIAGSRLPFALFIAVWLSIWSVGVSGLAQTIFNSWKGSGPKKASSIGLVIFAIPFFIGELFGLGALAWATSIFFLLIFVAIMFSNILFYHLLKAPTILGRRAMDRIEGFKMYLSVAERDELRQARLSKDTPELYERYLPYALALDVEQQWSERFSEALAQQTIEGESYHPLWFSSGAMTGFSAATFASSLSGSFSSAIASSSVAPGSHSGGGGGGSSGGGGGGGGGGGW